MEHALIDTANAMIANAFRAEVGIDNLITRMGIGQMFEQKGMIAETAHDSWRAA